MIFPKIACLSIFAALLIAPDDANGQCQLLKRLKSRRQGSGCVVCPPASAPACCPSPTIHMQAPSCCAPACSPVISGGCGSASNGCSSYSYQVNVPYTENVTETRILTSPASTASDAILRNKVNHIEEYLKKAPGGSFTPFPGL